MICGHFCNMSTICPYPVPCHVICLFITKKTDSYVMKCINQIKYAHITVVTFWKYNQKRVKRYFYHSDRLKFLLTFEIYTLKMHKEQQKFLCHSSQQYYKIIHINENKSSSHRHFLYFISLLPFKQKNITDWKFLKQDIIFSDIKVLKATTVTVFYFILIETK